MKNKGTEAVLLIISGLIIIAGGLYIYFVAHTIYPGSSSGRMLDLNWLLKTFGRLPLTILICIVGLFFLYKGVKKILR